MELVRHHQADLASNGVTTLPGLVTSLAIDTAVKVVRVVRVREVDIVI